MSALVCVTRSTLRHFPEVISNMLDGPDLIKIISLIAFCSVLLSFNVSSLSSSLFNAYAQTQSGSATSGAATGGSATAGGVTFTGGTCNQCTIVNAPQATGGAAASGAATSGNAIGPEATSSISTLVDKGNALLDLRMYTQAIQNYDQALAIDPTNKYVLFNKGNALNILGNYTQAIQYFDKVLAIDPNYKDALNGKGIVLAKQGNYNQAISYFDKVLAIDPNDKGALNNKGLALSDQGNYSQAIQYYDKALAIDPNNFAILVNKGNALDGLGNYTQAIQYYDKALAIDPNDPNNQTVLNLKASTLHHVGSHPPPIATSQSIITYQNRPVNITLAGSAPQNPNATLTAHIVSAPLNGNLSDINQETGTVTYTPHPYSTGDDSFTFKVNDGKTDSSNTGTVNLRVSR
jgi:Flp pilus assembly protein TadD